MEHFEPSAEELLAHNRSFADAFDSGDLPVAPRRRLALITCMDSRMDAMRILGLSNGEAHILRNAGGVVTDDVIRSLCLSQRALGTREVILVHHTDCGLQKVTDDGFRSQLEAELGVKPEWAVEAFQDVYTDVRQSMRRIHSNPFIAHKDHIRGFVYDVHTGTLTEVEPG